jgi:hypothetical protein
MTKEKNIDKPNSDVQEDASESDPTHEDQSTENDTTKKRNVIDPVDFPTLALTLEEARRQYDDEEVRRENVENKTGTVVTVDTLVITFATLIGGELHPLVLIAIVMPALAGAGLGLYTVRSRRYEQPGRDINDLYTYSEYDSNIDQQEQLLLNYISATKDNRDTNTTKFRRLNICMILTFISLLGIAIVSIIVSFLPLSNSVFDVIDLISVISL